MVYIGSKATARMKRLSRPFYTPAISARPLDTVAWSDETSAVSCKWKMWDHGWQPNDVASSLAADRDIPPVLLGFNRKWGGEVKYCIEIPRGRGLSNVPQRLRAARGWGRAK